MTEQHIDKEAFYARIVGFFDQRIRCHAEFCVTVHSRKARKLGLDWL